MIEEFFSTMPTPPVAQLLGWRFISWHEDTATLTVAFEGKPEFTNPTGAIQGGLLTAMLDDCMGPAILAKSGGRLYGPTIDLQVQFLRPVLPGPIRVVGRVIRMGRSVAHLDAELFDSNERLAARAMASAALTEAPRNPETS